MLSVIVVTHQSEKEIANCLASILKQAQNTLSEIIVVDAGSTDKTKSVVHQSCSTAKYYQLRNIGFAGSANFGASKASGDILFFLNPDAVLSSQVLERVVGSFETNEVGVLGVLLRDGRGVPELYQDVDFPSLKGAIFSHLNNQSKEAKNGLVECNWVSGGALVVRKELFDNLEGFSEKFFLYFEDVDFCHRLKDLGNKVFLNYDVSVQHAGGKSAGEERRLKAYDYSQARYFSVHRSYGEYLLLLVLRPIFRYFRTIMLASLLMGISLFSVVFSTERPLLIFSVGMAVILAVSRWPNFGIYTLFASVMIGQTIRLSLGASSITTTDVLLPFVLSGLFFAVIVRGLIKDFGVKIFGWWWLVVALLPGVMLAYSRLPLQDFVTTLSYLLRIFAILLLIPLWQVLGLNYKTVKASLIFTAFTLAILGFIQLLFLPVLPPTSNNIVVQLFLGQSGGGWDPHHFRLFATWLDPNFMGEFFVIALSVLLAGKSFSKLSLLSAGMIFGALVLTQSRSSFLALLVVCGLYFVFSKTKRLIVPITTTILATLAIFPIFAGRIFVSPFNDPTVQLRMSSWLQAWQQFKRFPIFGTGYNAYGVEQLALGNVNNSGIHSLAGTDNFLLLLLVTSGVWGFSIVVIAMARFISKLIGLIKSGSEAGLVVLLALSSLFVHGQFIQSVTYVHLLLPIAILIASLPKSEGVSK